MYICNYNLCASLGNGVDFITLPKSVRVQPGQVEYNVTIDIIDDISKGMELLFIPSCASYC